jgi:hypothetical protein
MNMLHAGEPAPYGKGMATEYDEAVRRATQLEPGLVSPAAAWTEALSSITRATANDLGVDPVSSTMVRPDKDMPSHATCFPLPHVAGVIIAAGKESTIKYKVKYNGLPCNLG